MHRRLGRDITSSPFIILSFVVGNKMNSDLKFGVVLLIFCLIFWFLIIPTQVAGAREASYPRFVIIWLGITSILLILKSWKGDLEKNSKGLQNKKGILRVSLIVMISFVYILMLDFLGFFSSSIIFLAVLMLSFQVRDWKVVIGVPLMFLLFVYFLFEKLLVFPLPRGILF